jgi:hypothetical protein
MPTPAERLTYTWVLGDVSNLTPQQVYNLQTKDLAGNPIPTGDVYELPKNKVEKYPSGSWERIVAEGLATFGVTVGDRTMHGQPSTAGPGVIAATQDPRWIGNWKGLKLKLSDFEVVHF